ncbi:BURP domain-containing protein 12 [Apostasia shenzhenica]|uniref:BURP domain-containing protein 12 n=1 Tax=Apostasia shenzhenica TaxID=1088818 RepID=A0A2I0B9X9_9ASPA|nr:BURP domain-containing protein 12 [Apostasia shenzhenica]
MSSLGLLLMVSLMSAAGADEAPPAKSSMNPFTEKAAVIRYWNRKVLNNLPHPAFIVSKLTPLSATDAATFLAFASGDPAKLSSRLSSFCSAAGLLCSVQPTPSLASYPPDSAFIGYEESNFTNYGTDAAGGLSSFKNYSVVPSNHFDTFHRYGRDSTGHNDSFSTYDPSGNVVTANFTSYGTNTAGGYDNFTSYGEQSNVPDNHFTNYATAGGGRAAGFSLYSTDGNGGEHSFSGYGKEGAGATADFISYGNNSNVAGSDFSNYAEDGNGNINKFTSYGDNANVPENNFRSYGSGVNGGIDKFSSYRDRTNVGDDFFTSYEKGGNAATADFVNYGNSFNEGSDNFKGYGEGSNNDHISFKSYFAVDNTTFKSYAKSGVTFKSYNKSSDAARLATAEEENRRPAAKRAGANQWVEPGKFFRESNLKQGTVMPMPDIRDRMPPRSFLPRSIAGKIPFTAAGVDKIFKILPGTAMAKAVTSTVADCERPPSRGETKRCTTSAEDMIDFAVYVLGGDVAVRSTAGTKGSNGNILIGEVKGVNGGKVTKSVSCHQSLFPYLVHYCHSVPKVRVYEADILAVDTKEKINHGVAICHIDTSDWSPTHGAFVALGPAPGKIEVCHWIFEGDMTWTVADRP